MWITRPEKREEKDFFVDNDADKKMKGGNCRGKKIPHMLHGWELVEEVSC